MKRNGKNQKMPKGVMVTVLDEKGKSKVVPLDSDKWSQMTNTQRRDVLKRAKEEAHADLIARVEANKAKKAKDNK